jgi:hypothetical protein
MHEFYVYYLFVSIAFAVLTLGFSITIHPQFRAGNILFALIASIVVGILWLLAMLAALGSLLVNALGMLEQDLCHSYPYLFANDPPKTHQVKD